MMLHQKTHLDLSSLNACVRVDNVEMFVEGRGEQTLVMIHGWPDTHRVWDAQVEGLKARYRCARFTLPGFDVAQPRRAVPLDRLFELFDQLIRKVSPVEPVTLLLHDWGCLFGYQFAARHPDRVAKIIGVDIGDAGASQHFRSLGWSAKAFVIAYQLWLVAAWRIGGSIGDRMTRWLARVLEAPGEAASIHAGMNYPYDIQWTGSHGSYPAAFDEVPRCPMLFIYGTRKAFMFHSSSWARAVEARPDSAVIAFKTGHWVMVERPMEFNQALERWLG